MTRIDSGIICSQNTVGKLKASDYFCTLSDVDYARNKSCTINYTISLATIILEPFSHESQKWI
jgi:hypothetical protein